MTQYVAYWTECGCLLACGHEHTTIREAVQCVPCASGYVVAVDDGIVRRLTAFEQLEFQGAIHAPALHGS